MVEVVLIAVSVEVETEKFDFAGYQCFALELVAEAATIRTIRPLIQSMQAEQEC